MLEFGIATIKHEADRIIVTGRCHHGPIRLGDSFKLVFRYSLNHPLAHSARAEHKAVALKVESIKANHHQLQWLDSGLSAQLELVGSGANLLEEGSVLSGE